MPGSSSSSRRRGPDLGATRLPGEHGIERDGQAGRLGRLAAALAPLEHDPRPTRRHEPLRRDGCSPGRGCLRALARAHRVQREHRRAHDDQRGQPQREPDAGDGDGEAADLDGAAEPALGQPVEQRREQRAGHHRHEHAQPHERVERAEHPAPQLVVDLLLQQHEAHHVHGPDGHAHEPDEQGRRAQARGGGGQEQERPGQQQRTGEHPSLGQAPLHGRDADGADGHAEARGPW